VRSSANNIHPLFHAWAESLATENASRLAAMENANNDVDELLEDIRGTFDRLRPSGIELGKGHAQSCAAKRSVA